jgi:N-acylneuraminate cytidylyltransferase
MWREDKGGVVPENYDPGQRPRRQGWEGQLVENGALYVTSRKRLLESGSRLSGRIGAYEMPAETYFELDEPDDWRYVDHILRSRPRTDGALASAAKRIKLFCVDVDGTLTDGGMYYADTGELMKRFDTTDAPGMRLLREQGIDLAIITSEDSAIVRSRARKLQIDSLYLGVKDKEACVDELLKQRSVVWEEVAFVGDDVNDLDALSRAGLSACPVDANPEVKAVAQYVCTRSGGWGAVREVCDLILAARALKGS